MSKWSVACVLRFLEIYQKHKCLWDPMNGHYKDRAARESSLNSIIEELGVSNITTNDIKLKIKSIRTAYKRELRAVLKSLNATDGKTYVPKLFWFKLADSFLRQVSISKRSKRLEVSSEADNEEVVIQQNFIKEPCEFETIIQTDSSNMKYQSEEIINCNELIEDGIQKEEIEINSFELHPYNEDGDDTMIEEHNEHEHREMHIETISLKEMMSNSRHIDNCNILYNKFVEEDDYSMFGHSIAAQLRAIKDVYSRSVAKFKIQQILFEAETGHYKNGI